MSAPRRRSRRRHYAKAPPMATAGGLVIAGIGAITGYQVTDIVDRYIATYSPTASPAPTLPAGVSLTLQQYNQQIVPAKPGMWRVVGGLVSMAFGFAGGAFAPWAGLKMFLYGWGLGATTHLSGQLLNGYVLEPLMTTNGQLTATGSRLFANEAVANAAVTPSTASSSSSSTTPATTTAPATGAATTPAGTPTQATSSNATQTGTQTTGTTAGLGAPPGLHSSRGTPMAALGPARTPMSAGARVPPVALAARRGAGLGASNDFGAVTPQQPPATSFTPPQTVYPPPAPSPPVQTVYPPPAPSPAPAQPAQNCAPCAPQPGPPQGATPCRGGCGGSCGGQCGEPPPPVEERNYVHPIFRAMNTKRSRFAA